MATLRDWQLTAWLASLMSTLINTGVEPFPVILLSQIIAEAAQDLTVSTGLPSGNFAHQERPINQQLYLATVSQFLKQLQTLGASKATVQAAIAEALYLTMYQATFSWQLEPRLGAFFVSTGVFSRFQ